MRIKTKILFAMRRVLCTWVMVLIAAVLFAQQDVKLFKIKDNMMLITLSKNLAVQDLNTFAEKFNIAGIGLHQLINKGADDSLKVYGWSVDASQQAVYVIKKPLQSPPVIRTNSGSIIFSAVPTPDNWRVVGGNKIIYGVNKLRDGEGFKQDGDTVYFFLQEHRNAKKVKLAGSFTNWQHGAFPMTKVDQGWIVPVKLKPGQYYYKFIINDGHWITDPNNELEENDGRGNTNSVYYVTNKKFELKGFTNASNVFIAGSFNNWIQNDIRLTKGNSSWYINMYLEPGSYNYNFFADGELVKENNNPKEDISIGNKHSFILKGFDKAKKVALAGNFNDWKPNELLMQQTADGWKISYALGAGNYQYKFIVDGNWITDPANPVVVNDGKGNQNSVLVIDPNYSFKLKGFANAKKVTLAGDFNDWSPEGLKMQRKGDTWVFPVYLGRGKHLYKFVVDGKWIIDPANPDWETDEKGFNNSVLWVE